jgi:hypothetical protein
MGNILSKIKVTAPPIRISGPIGPPSTEQVEKMQIWLESKLVITKNIANPAMIFAKLFGIPKILSESFMSLSPFLQLCLGLGSERV